MVKCVNVASQGTYSVMLKKKRRGSEGCGQTNGWRNKLHFYNTEVIYNKIIWKKTQILGKNKKGIWAGNKPREDSYVKKLDKLNKKCNSKRI